MDLQIVSRRTELQIKEHNDDPETLWKDKDKDEILKDMERMYSKMVHGSFLERKK